MGGAGVRRRRRVEGRRTGLGAALALTLIAGSASSQEAPEFGTYRGEFRSLTAEIDAGADDPAVLERRAKVAEYLARWDLESPPRVRALWAGIAARHARDNDLQDHDSGNSVLQAQLLRSVGEAGEARAVLHDAIESTPEAVRGMPYLHFELAETERYAGDYSAALRALAEVDPAWGAAIGRHPEVSEVLRSFEWRIPTLRASIELELGIVDRAVPFLRDAREALGAVPFEGQPDVAYDLVILGWVEASVHFVRSEHERVVAAVEALFADPRLAGAVAELEPTLRVMRGRALVHLERSDPAREPRAYDELLAVLELEGCSDLVGFEAEWNLAQLDVESGSLSEARYHLDSARGRSVAAPGVLRARDEVHLARIEARYALASDADEAALAGALDQLLAAYERLLAEWEDSPQREAGIAFLQDSARRALLSELVRLHLALDGEERGAERALEQLLRAQSMNTILRRLGFEGGSLADVRAQLLAEDRGILVYLPGLHQSHVLVLDDAGTRAFELVRRDELEALRVEHRPYMTAPPDSRRAAERERHFAGRLADELFPVGLRERMKGWKGATLVGMDLLGTTAFEVLPLGETVDHLGLELALDHLPSLPFGLFLASRPLPPARELDACIIAAPQLDEAHAEERGELDALVLSDAQRKALAAPYGAERIDVLRGEDATLEATRAAMERARVVQFLLHGDEDPARERPMVLVLRDGVLGAREIARLTAPPVVILTACRSAAGPPRSGDAAASQLAGAWFEAGARVVLHADVDLSYRAALVLSATLHEHLAQGDSPAEALRHARRAVANDSETAHPFFHGALRVEGLGQVPVFGRD